VAIGARIRNEGGSLVQIDPSYRNLALKATGSVTTAQLGSTGAAANCGVATITVGGCDAPFIAIRCSSAFVSLRKRTQSGSSFTWELITSTPVVTVQYWIFDFTAVAQMAFVTSKGLRIRSPADNSIIFDSRYKYLRALGMTDPTSTSTPVTPSGRTFAIGLTNPSQSTIVAGGSTTPGFWMYQIQAALYGFRTDASAVAAQRIVTRSFTTEGPDPPPYPTGTYGPLTSQALIVDITNY
jgi:hypothetical protein